MTSRRFCKEVFGASWVSVEHVAPLAAWEVGGNAHGICADAKITYTTQRKTAFELLQAALNSTAPVVYDEVYDHATHPTRRIRNADEAEAAQTALAAIAQRFSLWIWEDPRRETRIVERYNETMNAHVLRSDDGSYLTFPALADDVPLWPWQRDFVDRALSVPAAFASHEVGLGKTRTAIALCMTLRQFGIANRPLYIVPNHLIDCKPSARRSKPPPPHGFSSSPARTSTAMAGACSPRAALPGTGTWSS
jgi:N12 class adenine-specific DNA methylase